VIAVPCRAVPSGPKLTLHIPKSGSLALHDRYDMTVMCNMFLKVGLRLLLSNGGRHLPKRGFFCDGQLAGLRG